MKIRVDFILIISHEASSALSHLKIKARNTLIKYGMLSQVKWQLRKRMFGLSIYNSFKSKRVLFKWLKTNSMLGNMSDELNMGGSATLCVLCSDLQVKWSKLTYQRNHSFYQSTLVTIVRNCSDSFKWFCWCNQIFWKLLKMW